MSAEGICFLDTNVLVYAFDRADHKRRQAAANLIHELASTNRLVLSTQVLQEFFVTMTRKVKKPLGVKRTLKIMENFAVWPLFTVDLQTILGAGQLSEAKMISFWDALILQSAKRAGAVTLYTEDMNHGQQIVGVRIKNPFK